MKIDSINFSSWIDLLFLSPTIGCDERVIDPCQQWDRVNMSFVANDSHAR